MDLKKNNHKKNDSGQRAVDGKKGEGKGAVDNSKMDSYHPLSENKVHKQKGCGANLQGWQGKGGW